jgi:hypothetical protein
MLYHSVVTPCSTIFVEYDTLGRQYSISAFKKQDNITEMHIYVKYEMFLSCAGNFPVSKFIYKLAKIEKKKRKKVGICTKTVSNVVNWRFTS